MLAKYFAPQMNEGGSFVLFSGVNAFKVSVGYLGVAITNGAVDFLTRSLAVELAPIRVNAVSPGVIDTGAWDALGEDGKRDYFAHIGGRNPARRIGTSDDVADAVLFAMTNTFMTGMTLKIDGGEPLAATAGIGSGHAGLGQCGMPADVAWRGKTVHTGIYKTPVQGPVMVRRLNIDGDGQGDLAGHGGEQRAVMVYQTESYEHWKSHLGRDDLEPGISARTSRRPASAMTRSASATGTGSERPIRSHPAAGDLLPGRYASRRTGYAESSCRPSSSGLLLPRHHRGMCAAGDAIVRTRRGRHELSVADVDALLYLPDRDVGHSARLLSASAEPGLAAVLRRAARREKLHRRNAAADRRRAGWTGFRHLRVAQTHRESTAVMSIELESEDGAPLPAPRPGQYLTLRIPGAGDPAPLRSYSLSCAAGARYRISVKREEHGLVSRWLHQHAGAGSVFDVAAPRGDFYLGDDNGPAVLVSAGIGITPVLAMLHALATHGSDREVWWLHITRDARTLAFGPEVNKLLDALPNAHRRVFYTADAGRPDQRAIAALDLPRDAAVYLCGPDAFMQDMRGVLAAPGSIRPAFAPSCSAHCRRSIPVSPMRRTGRHTCPTDLREPGHQCRSRAAGSPSTGRNLRQHPRARGGLRRAHPVLLPQWRLPYVRHRTIDGTANYTSAA